MSGVPKTDVHGLHKKNINFLPNKIFEKIKRGAGTQVQKKPKILGQQKFLADEVAGRPKNWPEPKIVPS